VLVSGFAVLALAPLGPAVAARAGDAAWVAARALRASGDLGPLGTWLDLRVPGPSFEAVALHVAGLAVLLRGRRGAGLWLLLAGQVVLAAGPLRGQADGRLHLTMVDVGQGDSLLLRSPSGRALVVDAGGSVDPRFDPGERRVAPELEARRPAHRRPRLTHAQRTTSEGRRSCCGPSGSGRLWEGPAALEDPAWRRVDAWLEPSGGVRA
jgi:hypothetical protein